MLSATRRGRRLIQGKLNVPSKQLAVREGGQAPALREESMAISHTERAKRARRRWMSKALKK